MLTEPASDHQKAVFFDPSGRRQRALAVLLTVSVTMALLIIGLLIIGLAGGAHPPRTSVARTDGPGTPAASTAARDATARHPPARQTAGLPPTLPGLPGS
jgi:hypothetical protein